MQDLVAVDGSSMVSSYQKRPMAEWAVSNGVTLASGDPITISLYFPQNDPEVGWYKLI